MPASMFRVAEILDMAIAIERQGMAFYDACLQMSESSEINKIFKYLRDQEDKHRAIFSGMKEKTTDLRLPEDFSGEYEGYLNQFVRDKVFSSPQAAAEKARDLKTVRAVVDWALGFEQDSIDFYSIVKHAVRTSDAEAIDGIIAEEKRHIERLRTMREKD